MQEISELHLEPKMITGMDSVDGLKISVDNEKLRKMRRCFSDPVLSSAQREEMMGVDVIDGLKISLGYRRSEATSEACRNNVEIDWDGEQADAPLLVRLLAQSLETLASVGMSPRRKRGPRSQTIAFLDLAQLQLGMRLGMHHQRLKSQDQMIGLNFADEREADFFSCAVNKQLAKQHNKKGNIVKRNSQYSNPPYSCTLDSQTHVFADFSLEHIPPLLCLENSLFRDALWDADCNVQKVQREVNNIQD
ncbi:uncharacterized protein LOC135204970 [Macrobrachium nipponense]|uniref:uncharacterized protein LOC135204970 n=1 Tax=Macrobrachium nipponense TaxID=159736 RepID=UPI0030C858EA